MEHEEDQKSTQKDVPDKHHRITHTEDMQQCSFLIRDKKPCKNRCSAESTVCQYHEPSRLAKERGLSILTKRPRGLEFEESITDCIDKIGKGGIEDDTKSARVTTQKSKNEITRISGSQNRMYNPLATPLIDVGCIGLPSESNWSVLLKNEDLPIHLDIGSARGKFLIDLAESKPERNFIGIEIRNKLVEEANGILEHRNKHGNCHFFCANFLNESHCLLFQSSFSHQTVDRISILFPDPWIKKKHQNRRVVQIPALISIAKILCKGGELIIASDVEDVINDARLKVEECSDLFFPVQLSPNKSNNKVTDTNTNIESDDNLNEECDPSAALIIQDKMITSSAYEIDSNGFVLSNPFKPLASEREQVCEMSWRRVFRLIYIRK